jgi:endonuclease-3
MEKHSKHAKAIEIIRILRRRYKIDSSYFTAPPSESAFENLVGTIISQRTKDETTDKVATALLAWANTPQKMIKLGRAEIAKIIRSANYYKGKSKRILEISKILLKKYKGRVPRTREELMELPGVGSKTADIVLLYSYGEALVPVDTHVAVVAQRLGWTKSKEPEKIREDLHALFSPSARKYVNILLVEFGKEICRAPVPHCYMCPIVKLCPYPNKNLK